jgi:type VI secretion system protein VasD
MMTRWLQITTLALITILIGACGSTGEKKVDYTYIISAAHDINPDITGQPSSVVVRVYQLSNRINFENASYEDLFAVSGNALGTEFIAVNELLVDPATTLELDVEISENAKFLGIVVGYRSVDMVTWRTIEEVPEKSFFNSSGLQILIEKLSVRVVSI